MVIEFLHVTCPVERRAAFLARDAEVWTAALARHPGFRGKEVWIDADDPTQIRMLVRWESMELWKSFTPSMVEATDALMGDLLMPVERCDAFHVSSTAYPRGFHPQ